MLKTKLFAFYFSFFVFCSAAQAATPWWLQPTICQLSPTKCYPSMGAGFDAGMWDANANCWGMKIICPDAFSTGSHNDPAPVSKTTLMAGTGIKVDFDTDLFFAGDGCYGARRTAGGGAYALVNGTQAKIYCAGVLQNPTETLTNGEITTGPQPTCAQLAADGWVAVQNGNCFGKQYSANDYFIECGNDASDLPNRIVAIRGASSFVTGGAGNSGGSTPSTQSAANSLFDLMIQASAARKSTQFNQ
ncbi:MAG: hypothetical protein LBK26_03285 [Rickettsiales bacterium]|jgi:hypothetical protein|nr:hypothetical protein [Rickettsiales bacterium]